MPGRIIEHLGVRLAVVLGRLPASTLSPGENWPELFSSYDELAERNGVADASPTAPPQHTYTQRAQGD